jgi:hypothetical protein
MSDMVRKQIYITRQQNLLLKRLAKLRGKSEAELLRNALQKEIETTVAPNTQERDSLQALSEILDFAFTRKDAPAAGQPYRFNRDEIYAERERRWIRDSDESGG